jgi:uncharacterized membrane protein YeaQ/YmgE (transglycosylase-associated protein family)
MILSVWHWLVILAVGGLIGLVTGFFTTRRVTGGIALFAFVGVIGAFLVDWVCATVFQLWIDLPVLYNLSLLFWMIVGAVFFTQILNLLGKKA